VRFFTLATFLAPCLSHPKPRALHWAPNLPRKPENNVEVESEKQVLPCKQVTSSE
jgi:hypothetical protein